MVLPTPPPPLQSLSAELRIAMIAIAVKPPMQPRMALSTRRVLFMIVPLSRPCAPVLSRPCATATAVDA
jgi:hypothetical protein